MEATSAVLAMFSLLLAGFVGLFGWTLSQTSKLGNQNAATSEVVRGLVARIDLLVSKLDANFTIQINEQVARNVLQEKVINLERQLRQAARARGGDQREEESV